MDVNTRVARAVSGQTLGLASTVSFISSVHPSPRWDFQFYSGVLSPRTPPGVGLYVLQLSKTRTRRMVVCQFGWLTVWILLSVSVCVCHSVCLCLTVSLCYCCCYLFVFVFFHLSPYAFPFFLIYFIFYCNFFLFSHFFSPVCLWTG